MQNAIIINDNRRIMYYTCIFDFLRISDMLKISTTHKKVKTSILGGK